MFVLVTVLLLVLPLAWADKVGVVVSFPDNSVYGQCLEVAAGTNGYDLLQKTGLSLLWAGPSTFGHMLCRINGVGDEVSGNACQYSGKYWGLLLAKDNAWNYLPVGFDGGSACWNGEANSYDGHYCAEEGDLLGFRYGAYGELPDFHSFDEVCNSLILEDITIEVDGDKESADEKGGSVTAKPASTLNFKIELKNNYPANGELEVSDIEAELTIENIDDGDDLEEDVSFDDLEEGEDTTEEMEVILPLLIADEEFKVELRITAETSTGLNLEQIINYPLKIDKERHDIVISRAELESEESCPGNSNRLIVELTNLGEKDEEEVTLLIRSDPLGLSLSQTLDLDAGADEDDVIFKKDFYFTVPAEVVADEYPLSIIVDYADRVEKTVTLKVKECAAAVEEEEEEQENRDLEAEAKQLVLTALKKTQTSGVTGATTMATQNYVQYDEKSFFEKNGMVIIIALAELFLVLVIIFIVLALRR